jgi:uncharacterized protein YjbI with pentapeptide repeats
MRMASRRASLTSSEFVRRLRARWEAPQQQELAALVLERLVFGGSFDGLGLGRIDGRVDLRGFQAPSPRRLREFQFGGLAITELAGLVEVVGVTWRSLDLSGANLEHLRVKDARIEDCRLDRAACLGMRIWRSAIADSTLVKADLRHAALGPWSAGGGNVYAKVDFSGADFRDCATSAAVYQDCDFSQARLDKVDFKSSSLIRCRFAGVLREVVFDGRVLSTGKPDPNPMQDVDLAGATLQLVSFRGIDVGRLRLPDDPALHVIDNYPCVLDHAVNALSGRTDLLARGLRAQLLSDRSMLAPGQRFGLYNRNDQFLLAEITGEDGEELAAFADEVLGAAERECAERTP